MNVKCDDTFRRYRNKLISDRISEVYRQQMWRNGTLVDFIDGDAAKGYVPEISDIYDKVDSKHAPNSAPKTIMNDPVMVNPCSYKAVEQVLKEINK